MQVTTEQIDPCKVALTITVEAERVVEARQKALQQATRHLQLPGFRKGKVPTHMAKGYIDDDKLRQRAAELIVPDAYNEALKESEIQPWAEPQFELVEMNEGGPLIFKAHVPLRPVVTLGPYKGLALERRNLTIRDTDIEREIEQVRERFAEYPEVERAVETGDIILAELQASVEGAELPDLAKPRTTAIEVGQNIADFDAGLIGMTKGEHKTIEAVYPDDFDDEAMRGKKGTFNVTVSEIRTRQLPELNDEFVQRIHKTAKTVDELRAAIKEGLESAATDMSENEVEFTLIRKIVDTSTIHFPEVLLHAEMQQEANQLAERLKQNKANFEDYLKALGKTREQWESDLAAGATQRIQNSLVLSEVARAEGLELTEEDIDAKIAERATETGSSPSAIRALAESQGTLEQIKEIALTEKIMRFLLDASKITEKTITPDDLATGDEAPPAKAAPKKAAAKKPAKAKAEAPAEPEAAAIEAPKAPAKRARKKAEE